MPPAGLACAPAQRGRRPRRCGAAERARGGSAQRTRRASPLGHPTDLAPDTPQNQGTPFASLQAQRLASTRRPQAPARVEPVQSPTRGTPMSGIIYLVGLVVIIYVALRFFGVV
jgi:hypothetical protein